MADKSLHAATVQVNIATTTVLAEKSNDKKRAFKLVTRAGRVYHHKFVVKAPLTVPVVDEVIAKLGSTESPLDDLQHLVASLSSLRDAYQGVTGLTAEMEDELTATAERLESTSKLLDKAACAIATFNTDSPYRWSWLDGNLLAARDAFLNAVTSIDGVVLALGSLPTGVPAEKQASDLVIISRALLIFQVWILAFEEELFA